MFFSLELLEKFKGPAKKFEITGVRDNERRLYRSLLCYGKSEQKQKKKQKKSGKNKNKLRIMYHKNHESFKNSKPKVQLYRFL